MIWEKISNSTENDYVDFKMKWYDGDSAKINMIHDILCMSNSLTDSISRYIVIGVKENKITKEKIYCDVSNDSNHRTSEDIIQLLRNYMSVVPSIEVLREDVSNSKIDIIKITPEIRNLPYTLNQDVKCKILENGKCKSKKLPKDWIYSRNASRNTPIDECCNKFILEELFARKRGEHLSIKDRFEFYLEDIENWKNPLSYENDGIIQCSFYYLKNYNFKIVIKENQENYRKIDKATCYLDILRDTGIDEDYWNYRFNPHHFCYDDFYSWFSVELWANNTLISVHNIMKMFIKYYFSEKNITTRQTFYLPLAEDIKRLYNIKTKEEILSSFIWKICRLFYKFDLPEDIPFSDFEASLILNSLNYEYIKDTRNYIQEHEEFIYKEPPKRI